MGQLTTFFTVLLGASWATPATAQDAADVTPEAMTLSYDEYRLDELNYVAKRSRNALIGTSAATAVGISLVTPALVKECARVSSSASVDDLRCSSRGRILLGVGAPILIAGATGMLVTAILYGVRKGKIKSIENRLAYQRHHTIHWDPRRGTFAF